jgi:hypothetical protein
VYYVRGATRGSAARMGTPRQAIAYITGSRDEHRDPGMSKAELEYVAQMGRRWRAREAIVSVTRHPAAGGGGVGSALAYLRRYEDGPKREFEGGRVPLVGFGTLAGDWPDERELATRFQLECFPWQVRRGTAGYKSFTLTLPKEVSLLAEGHRQKAKTIMCDAAEATLADAFPDLDLSAVGAIHTRNEAGEVHFHMHLLVAKFARHRATDRYVSLNSKAGGNDGRRIWNLKRAWKSHIDRLLKERLGVEVEQGANHASVGLRLSDGQQLGALNADSRRVLEKLMVAGQADRDRSGRVASGSPRPSVPSKDSGPRRIKIGLMDDRIYEVASGQKGQAGWDATAFVELFPEHAKFVARYEKRVRTLKEAGYLSADGTITADFQMHYGLRRGVDSPELHGIRADLVREAERESAHYGVGARIATVGEAFDWNPRVRARLGRLGHSRHEVLRLDEEHRARRPTRDQLDRIRAEFCRPAAEIMPRMPSPGTKGLVRAFVDVQSARVRWVMAISSGILTLSLAEKRNVADKLLHAARGRLVRAQEQRLARAGLRLRSWFWAIRVVVPRDVRRLEIAIERCARLTRSQEVQKLYRKTVLEDRTGRGGPPVDPRLKDFRGVAFALELPDPEAVLLLGRPERPVGVAADVSARLLEKGHRPDPQEPRSLPERQQRIIPPDRRGEPPRAADDHHAPEISRSPPSPRHITLPTAHSARGVVPKNRHEPTAAARAPADAPEPALRWFRRGAKALVKHRPKLAVELERYRARDVELRKGGGASAAIPRIVEQAVHVGRLLEREENSRCRLTLPSVFERDRNALERASVRLDALGVKSPFTADVLLALAPLEIRQGLDEFRKSGLLDDGPAWIFDGKAVADVATGMRHRFLRQMDQDLGR